MPKRVLIANRGEIAVRVIRACRELGIESVAVYADPDRESLHVRMADRAVRIGPGPAAESYLAIDRLIAAAHRVQADAVHPGYGFLAENAAFAQACLDAGLRFIGPPPDAIRRMGSKTAAREVARTVGVPIVPGTGTPFGVETPLEDVVAAAARVGFPLLVKAVAGGGGKGMRVVARPDDLPLAVQAARSEAQAAFGDGAIYLERRLAAPRHIEIQLMADAHGTVVSFVERECSIQRRHQKVVEEAPSPILPVDLRPRMMAAARRVALEVGYVNAGTIEFLVDGGEFYFLEMNTRLQVEHPVTELVTGIDLVQWQLRIADGERLTIDPAQAASPQGHAIECRIYAEDADAGFLPSPGRIESLIVPGGPGVRDDRGMAAGFTIPLFYDSLIAKLTVWGETRDRAIARLTRALDEYRITGVRTTLPFFRWLVAQPEFRTADFDTTYLDRLLATRQGMPFTVPTDTNLRDTIVAAAIAAWFERSGDRAAGNGSAGPVNTGAWRRAARREGRE